MGVLQTRVKQTYRTSKNEAAANTEVHVDAWNCVNSTVL